MGNCGGWQPLGPALGLADRRTLRAETREREQTALPTCHLQSLQDECPFLSAPGGGLHVFLEGEVVVGEVGVEVEFAEVYFFVIGGGVVRGLLGGIGVIFLGGFL